MRFNNQCGIILWICLFAISFMTLFALFSMDEAIMQWQMAQYQKINQLLLERLEKSLDRIENDLEHWPCIGPQKLANELLGYQPEKGDIARLFCQQEHAPFLFQFYIEKFLENPCLQTTILDEKIGLQNQSVLFYRITLWGQHSSLPIAQAQQLVVTRLGKSTEKCKENTQFIPLGRLSWRERN